MHAVILAGGKGVRLRPYTTCLPKPLVPIGERYAILEIILHQLHARGFERATLAVGHLGHLIRAFVGDGRRWGIRVDFAEETEPLGTIGPLLGILDRLPARFLVMNGDVLTNLDFADVLLAHGADGAPLTIATYDRTVQVDFGVLECQHRHVTRFVEKPVLHYAVSMGVYAMDRATLASYPKGTPFGFDELVLDLLQRGTPPATYAFDGFWLDIGRPDDYDEANLRFAELEALLLPAPPLPLPDPPVRARTLAA